MQKVRQAYAEWAQEGMALEAAVKRWRPDPHKPGKALDGSDLDQHPPEHRARKLREAQQAIRNHDAQAVTQIDALVLEAQKEPQGKFELGTRLGAADLGEVHLLVQQYRDLARPQQAELQTLGQAALERGDLIGAIQHQRAARTLHVNTPELDSALVEKDPVRQEGKAQLDVLRTWAAAAHADIARRHVVAGIAEAGEQISYRDYAHRHGVDPDGGTGSFVQAVVGGGAGA
jgi:hypothetical protein